MNDNIKKNNNQHNDDIENDPKFDNQCILPSRTKDPLPVVTVRLIGGKKHRAIMVSILTCLWYSGANNSIIKIKHTKYYERRMRSNNVEYSTAVGTYCTTHEVKVTFCMPEFSSSKIIKHRFHVDNYKGKLDI